MEAGAACCTPPRTGNRSTGHRFGPGHSFRYFYDALGNRLLAAAGGNQNGDGLETVRYTPNAFNQYASLENPSTRWITGQAELAASVSVNEEPALEFPAFPVFAKLLELGNTEGPALVQVDILATLPGAGPMGQDLVRDESGSFLAPPRSVDPVLHDDDGNLVQDGLWTYTWDGENRLVRMESLPAVPDSAKRKLTFSYDWQGRRITKKVEGGYSGGSYTAVLADRRFLYDGWNLIVEWDEALTGTPHQCYLWGIDLSGSFQGAGGVGGLLSISKRSFAAGYETMVPSYDTNGNITALTRIDGTAEEVAGLFEYSPFGELLRSPGNTLPGLDLPNPFGFSTKYRDGESGLVYYGFRFYDPGSGRWGQRDPIGEHGGLNVFSFVSNNPINGADSLGLIDYRIKLIKNTKWTPSVGDFGQWGADTSNYFMQSLNVSFVSRTTTTHTKGSGACNTVFGEGLLGEVCKDGGSVIVYAKADVPDEKGCTFAIDISAYLAARFVRNRAASGGASATITVKRGNKDLLLLLVGKSDAVGSPDPTAKAWTEKVGTGTAIVVLDDDWKEIGRFQQSLRVTGKGGGGKAQVTGKMRVHYLNVRNLGRINPERAVP